MSRDVHVVRGKGFGDDLIHPKTDCRPPSCDMDGKLRNQLSRLLSPEFDVTIGDVREIINILNVIKAKCALKPGKFRLLIGLLREVDLSITNIEEHYEQLLIKNRIFHLLKMFPDVAHLLLDVIARATNRCSPLASLPVTIGRLEEERQQSKGFNNCNNGITPGSTTRRLNRTTCFRTPAQNGLIFAAVPGTQQANLLSPHRMPWVTPRTPRASSSQMMPVTSSAGQPLAGRNLPAEFDLSRRMYDQAPPSFRQSSLLRHAGVVNASGAKESPTDIQKRILLQQQRHLRRQLEILQAQRLQQISCVRNLTFEQKKKTSQTATRTIPKTPSHVMESSAPPTSAGIGPPNSFAQPVRITRSCSQIAHRQQPILGVARNSQSNTDVQALDLRSPERREASAYRASFVVASGKNNKSPDTNLTADASKNLSVKMGTGSNESLIEKTGQENVEEDKAVGLCLSQVGRHCIMVSVRDGSAPKTQAGAVPEPGEAHGKKQSAKRSTKSKTKQKQKKGKAGHGRCRGVVINVKKLCHMHDTRQSSNQKSHTTTDPANHSRKVAVSTHGLDKSLPDITVIDEQVSKSRSETSYPDNINTNNNNCKSILQDFSRSHKQISSKKRSSHRQSKSGKKKRQRSSHDDGTVQGIRVSDSQLPVSNLTHLVTVSEKSKPLDLSHTLAPTQPTGNTTNGLNAANAEFEPETGLWQRKPDNVKGHQQSPHHHQPRSVEPSQASEVQSLEDAESTYLLYSGCDDEAWYQSSQSDEVDILSNRNEALAGHRSSSWINSPLRSGSFLGRLVHSTVQRSPVVANSTEGAGAGAAAAAAAAAAATATAVPATLPPHTVKRKLQKIRSSKDKHKKKKH